MLGPFRYYALLFAVLFAVSLYFFDPERIQRACGKFSVAAVVEVAAMIAAAMVCTIALLVRLNAERRDGAPDNNPEKRCSKCGRIVAVTTRVCPRCDGKLKG